MANEFKNKDEFIKEFKKRIIRHFGCSIERAHITEKYMTLGEMVSRIMQYKLEWIVKMLLLNPKK